ncbi:uncharacterized protein LOC134811457 [Bolinopsis microptera]|uniref:uncharacterized protein LOC134811457 n=1 Tax=Bolinopsis microptera TaxID=2820187 RepID=UPI003079BE29
MDSCVKRKKFTKECFQNECDGTMYYLKDTVLATLSSCYNQYKVNGTCGRKECWETFSSYQAALKTCNCYHTYQLDGIPTDTTKSCQDRKDFYDGLSNLCTEMPSHTTLIITIVLSTGGLLSVAAVMYFGQKHAVNYGRELKKSGRIGSILKYIDWDKITPLGAAAFALGRNRNPDNLQDKEIVLKIRFNLLGGCFGVQCQHVVLKIFSESQSEQQGVEMGIINSISDKEKAKECNIISVYGPTKEKDNNDLISFLETLIKKSTKCAPLRDVIKRSYLGGDQDQNMEIPRCKYIMMNHCNELSLTKFIGSNRLTLDLIKHLCKNLAEALNYLHEINKPTIVHCDIKPDNIFVKSRNKKTSFILGDFGFAEKTEGKVFRLRGSTPSYVPPEWYLDQKDNKGTIELKNECASELQKRVFSERAVVNKHKTYCKIDIYAYGLIIWLALYSEVEPWTEKSSDDYKNYKKEQTDQNNRISKEKFLRDLFNDPNKFETRPKFEDDHSNANKDFKFLLDLARNCWQSDSRLRPSASNILQMLHDNVLISSRNSRRVVYQVHNSVSAEVQPTVHV